ncbi:hypothetical protein V6Z11_1Z091500 [Gossypium hirsutum]
MFYQSIEEVAAGPNFASSDKSIDETAPTITFIVP